MIRSETKAWGKVQHIFSNNQAAVSVLEVEAGKQCSRHIHVDRNNQFNVMSGAIVVERWENGARLSMLLKPGQSWTVYAGIEHRFRVIESGQVIEIYWPYDREPVRENDILRVDEGGPDPFWKELRKEFGYAVDS